MLKLVSGTSNINTSCYNIMNTSTTNANTTKTTITNTAYYYSMLPLSWKRAESTVL